MEEIRTKGVVIDAIDYKEYDKIITIFTLELGVIKAVVKGVKRPTAKMRFAGQILCFGEFILSKRGDMYTVITLDLVESFFEIAYNYEKFLLSVDFIKIVKFVNKYNPDSSELFVVFVAILNVLLKTQTDNNVVYIKFLIETLKALGYEHEYKICEKCRKPHEEYAYIDKFSGAIVCRDCVKDKSLRLNKDICDFLDLVAGTSYVELEGLTLPEEKLLNALKYLQILFKINCG